MEIWSSTWDVWAMRLRVRASVDGSPRERLWLRLQSVQEMTTPRKPTHRFYHLQQPVKLLIVNFGELPRLSHTSLRATTFTTLNNHNESDMDATGPNSLLLKGFHSIDRMGDVFEAVQREAGDLPHGQLGRLARKDAKADTEGVDATLHL